MNKYLVDFIFLPDRSGGIQIAVTAPFAGRALDIAGDSLRQQHPDVLFEHVSTTKADQ